jgi:hypothetical protein
MATASSGEALERRVSIVFCHRVAARIASAVRAIDYDAVKPAFADRRRSGAYFDVWSRMDDLQWELAGEQQIARSKT